MRLESLRVERTAGVDRPFELTGFAPGLTVVVGPNASGKSVVCRTVRELLWGAPKGSTTRADLHLSTAAGRARVSLDATARTWTAVDPEASEPSLAPAHLASCFLLRAADLLATEERTDRDVAHEIRVRTAGGYDLDGLREREFTVGPQHGQRARSAWTAAETQLERVQQEARALAEDEERRAEYVAAIERADAARTRVRVLETSIRLAEESARAAEIDAALLGLPAGLDALSGREPELLAEREDELRARTADLDDAQAELESVRTELARLALDGDPAELLRELVPELRRARRLEQLEQRCAEAAHAATAADAEARAANDRLAAAEGAAREAPLDAEELARLDAFLQRAQARREDTARCEAVLAALRPARECAEVEVLEEGAAALRSHDAHALDGAGHLPLLWSAALALGLGGAWAARYDGPEWSLVAGFGLGLGVWAFALGSTSRRAREARRAARAAFGATGLDAPETWSPDAVRAHLDALEDELVLAREERLLAAEREYQARRLHESTEALEELERERRALARDTGVDAGESALTLVELARRLRAAEETAARLAAADARADALHEELRGELEALEAGLAARGVEARGADRILAELERLDERAREAQRLGERARDLEARLPRVAAARDEARARLERVFADAGVAADDRAELERRVAALPEFRELDAQRRTLAARIEHLRAELEGGGEELDAESARAQLAEVQDEAARYEEHVSRCARLDERLRAARASTQLEDALAARDEAKDELLRQRERALDAAAGAFLLRDVVEEHRRESSPLVLRRAAELFAAFTQQRYELRLEDADDGSRFRALDVDRGELQELSQLSDGTRMQLLLAARFAFALEIDEVGVPFLLDEALSFTDPVRFEQVARSVLELVAAGRQVVYLTSRPGEASAFARVADERGDAAPVVLDLAAARGAEACVAVPAELEFELRPELPPVGASEPEAYGARLGVPLPRPHEPVEGLHLFHLLRDDRAHLPLLRELLSAGWSRVGRWETAGRNGSARTVVRDAARRAWLDARCALARAVYDARAIGRGRPVGRAELLASGAVSDKYVDGLAELVGELQGDAARLVEALLERSSDDARTKGFRRSKAEDLQRWFEDAGHVDPRPPLDEDEVRDRVLRDLVEPLASGVLEHEEVARLTELLWATLERGAQRVSTAASPDLAREGA